jgi:hypothetical protein
VTQVAWRTLAVLGLLAGRPVRRGDLPSDY